MVVPCDDALIREVRNAAIDGAAKCRLLPITGPEHLGHVGSKVGLARALERAGVAAPRFAVVESAGDLVAACEGLGYPLVVKVDESGAERACSHVARAPRRRRLRRGPSGSRCSSRN